jgi:hypothetical protein
MRILILALLVVCSTQSLSSQGTETPRRSFWFMSPLGMLALTEYEKKQGIAEITDARVAQRAVKTPLYRLIYRAHFNEFCDGNKNDKTMICYLKLMH